MESKHLLKSTKHTYVRFCLLSRFFTNSYNSEAAAIVERPLRKPNCQVGSKSFCSVKVEIRTVNIDVSNFKNGFQEQLTYSCLGPACYLSCVRRIH